MNFYGFFFWAALYLYWGVGHITQRAEVGYCVWSGALFFHNTSVTSVFSKSIENQCSGFLSSKAFKFNFLD